MNRRIHVLKYLVSDLASAAIAWTLFFIFRKLYIEPQKFGYEIPVEFGERYFLGLLIIPLAWVFFYYSVGYYKDIYRKSRLLELGQTLLTSTIGVVVIFFVLILDDAISTYESYYHSFAALWVGHFVLTYTPRLLITSHTIRRLRRREIGFNTIIVGSNGRAIQIFEELESQPESSGNKIVGFVNVLPEVSQELREKIRHLGDFEQLKTILGKHGVEEVIIAIESSEYKKLTQIINKLKGFDVRIKVITDMYGIMRGHVNMTVLSTTPLIEISHELMPAFQQNLKRIMDIMVSAFALVLLSPLYLVLIIGVKLSSRGPVFYTHERIGLYGKPFMIYKFRSMYVGAEKHGPALSSENDSRITPFGRFLRKARLDELPQFYNVLVGDMSLVGPRPERQFYIDQIVKKAPHYFHLQKVKPGITSWGQVKYGYAENVDEMIERLRYDIIYIENMSLYADLKILIYTIKTVLKGLGK